MRRNIIKRAASIMLVSVMALSVFGCGDAGADTGVATTDIDMFEPLKPEETKQEQPEDTSEPEDTKAEEEALPAEIPEGMYASELTGLPISEELKNQRPIAVMVDNEIEALPHFGTAACDVIYEMMNSTINNRITRLMAVVKDYEAIEQLGSIRSTRPTNILLAAEWNAVLCHDGGPQVHINPYFDRGFCDHFSGTFSRVNNGKKREFTEYILSGDLDSQANFGSGKVTKEYWDGFSGDTPHFNFVEYGKETHLEDKYEKTYKVKQIILPFPHNGSVLLYNDDTEKYEYYEYGERHEDEDTGAPLAFDNVILQDCSFSQLDENGYLIYNCLDAGKLGFYITKGVAKSISWSKHSDQDFTRFYDDNGEEIVMNRGKTYISLVPEDSWDKLIMNEVVPEE